jgi:hypothetical protein
MAVSCSPGIFPLYSPNFTRHEFSREPSSSRSLNRSFSYRKSTLITKAPMQLSHARKTSESYCRRHFHDCGRQSEMKRRASSIVACGPQTVTMQFHDGTADRQTHAAALRLRSEEGIEDLVRSSGRQSYSGIRSPLAGYSTSETSSRDANDVRSR